MLFVSSDNMTCRLFNLMLLKCLNLRATSPSAKAERKVSLAWGCQMTRSAGNPHIRESRISAPVGPRMQAAGLQCLLRLPFPTPKSAHFPVRRFPGKSGHPKAQIVAPRAARRGEARPGPAIIITMIVICSFLL